MSDLPLYQDDVPFFFPIEIKVDLTRHSKAKGSKGPAGRVAAYKDLQDRLPGLIDKAIRDELRSYAWYKETKGLS